MKVAGLDIGNYGIKAVFGPNDEDQFILPTVVDFVKKKSTTMTEELAPNDLLDYFKIRISSNALGRDYNGVSLVVGKGAAGGREMPIGSQKHQ